MLISCTTSLSAGPSTPSDFTCYHKAGCEAVQLTCSRREPSEVVASLNSADLGLSGVDVGTLDASNKRRLAADVARFRTGFEWVGRLGAKSVCVRTGDRRSQPLPVLLGGLRAFSELAEMHDLDLHLANARDSTIEQIEDLRQLVDIGQCPRLRLAVDVGEFHASAVNARDVLAEFGDLVGCIRISDRIGKRRVPLGQGEVNLRRIVEKAKECGYDAWFVLDACEEQSGGVGDTLADAVAYLKKLG